MVQKRPLKPWAQNIADAFRAGVLGAITLGTFSGLFLLFISARLITSVLLNSAPGPLGPTILWLGFLLFAVWWWTIHSFDEQRWPLIAGLEGIFLLVINLVWTGLLIDVATFGLMLLFILTYLYRDKIVDGYRVKEKRENP